MKRGHCIEVLATCKRRRRSHLWMTHTLVFVVAPQGFHHGGKREGHGGPRRTKEIALRAKRNAGLLRVLRGSPCCLRVKSLRECAQYGPTEWRQASSTLSRTPAWSRRHVRKIFNTKTAGRATKTTKNVRKCASREAPYLLAFSVLLGGFAYLGGSLCETLTHKLHTPTPTIQPAYPPAAARMRCASL